MFEYVDKSSGRRRRFRKKEGSFVARLTSAIPSPHIAVFEGVDEQAEGDLALALAARLLADERLDAFLNVLEDDEGNEVCVVPDELAVQFRSGVAQARIGEILRSAGLRVARHYREADLISAAGVSGDALFSAIERLNAWDEVEICGPLTWGLDNREQSEEAFANDEAFEEIRVPWTWGTFGTGSSATRLAIIDTGFDLDHPALATCVAERPEGHDWDFATSDLSPGEDRSGHGTAVAGLAAGRDAAARFVGVAPECGLVPLKVKLVQAEVLQRVAALRYLARNAQRLGVRVVNCSWYVDTDEPFLRSAMRAVVDAGCLIVCSAGNKGHSRPHYPSDYDFRPFRGGARARGKQVGALQLRARCRSRRSGRQGALPAGGRRLPERQRNIVCGTDRRGVRGAAPEPKFGSGRGRGEAVARRERRAGRRAESGLRGESRPGPDQHLPIASASRTVIAARDLTQPEPSSPSRDSFHTPLDRARKGRLIGVVPGQVGVERHADVADEEATLVGHHDAVAVEGHEAVVFEAA